MQSFNGYDYPSTAEEVAKCSDSGLKTMIEKFARSRATSADNTFINAKPNKSNYYNLLDNAGLLSGKPMVTISAQDAKKVRKSSGSADSREAVSIKKMVSVVTDAQQMVTTELYEKALETFYDTKTFKDYHRKKVWDSIKVNKQMAEKLGISDLNDFKKFQFYMKMGEQNAANKLLAESSEKEELKKKGPAIVKKLMAQNR